MTENEQKAPDSKQKIRDRYKGIDASELEFILAKPPKSSITGAKKRVAAYIRVSTDKDEQTSSYELQKNYFEEYIKAQSNWEYVGDYADEGISGTSMEHRGELQRLLDDCRDGKIDYVITKSISRFARNIVDCLNMIEELRNLKPPVGVIFATEHIDTLATNDSLLLSILASLAEAESRNKSEIMNWSIENRFNRGIFLLPELLGFDKDEEGKLIINKNEADTVKLCFYLFIAGFSMKNIAELLTALERKTGYNKMHNKMKGVEPTYNTIWTSSGVVDVLRNERHCGDVLARKTFTPNFKTHKSVRNRGERPQVRKRGNHDGIVSRKVWEAANRKLDLMYGTKDKPLPTLKVIDEGVLKGYVPVNRNWAGFTLEDFKIACESVYEGQVIKTVRDSSILDGFRVISSQLFSSTLYPSVTISNAKIRFNTACLRQFENVEYVELLLNSVEKCLAIRPCKKTFHNAIRWGSLKDGKWTALEKSCRGFSAPLYKLMSWDKDTKYKMRGSYVSDGVDQMMIFELDDSEQIRRVMKEDTQNTDEASAPRYKNVIIHSVIFGRTVEEDRTYLERIHYASNWDVLRPAKSLLSISKLFFIHKPL